MIHRLFIGFAAMSCLGNHLHAQALPGQSHGIIPGVSESQVLQVTELDQKAGRILFKRSGLQIRKVKEGQKEVTQVEDVTLTYALNLKESQAITADGKPVKDAELWNRIKPGKRVVVLSPQVRQMELDMPIRALFKDDTIVLIGFLNPLPDTIRPIPKIEAPKK